MRAVEEPTVDERGYERHPAWALLGAARVSGGNTALFASEIRHNNTVQIKLSTAMRSRSLHHDRHFADRTVFEVEMSEAQWASFVSSMNVGDGVPVTVRFAPGSREVPDVPFEPRLRETMAETRVTADEAYRAIREAFEAFEKRPIKANRERLKYAIANAPANVEFAAKSLSEHAENVVQKARADIEAMVVAKAEQLGIEPGELVDTHELGMGEGQS